MPPPIKSSKPAFGGKISEDSETPSNNLWVGNLSSDVTETDLMNLFSKHGVIDSITSYASRSYAFVYFKRVEDAKAAVQALRGTVLRGQSLKIEFAKPAKPCKSLWVSGISPSITKEALEEEFLKFGKIEEFKFIRDRNTAYVDYFRLEDASQALKGMNGKRIGGDQMRVDFLRSHTSKKEHWADYHDAREGQFLSRGLPDSLWMPQDMSRRQQLSGGRKLDGHPSNVLWIGYPPSVHIDEQMLHNAMILFGEIERIKSFPSRNYSFVEFRSVDEARRAKEGLQGRLFNDPRITILYSSSDLTPGKDYPGVYPGVKGPRPDMFLDESPFPPALMDVFSHSRPMLPNALSAPAQSSGILGTKMLIRPFGAQGGLNPLLSGPELHDLALLHKIPDANPKSLMGGPNWRRSSPVPETLSSPTLGMKRPGKPASSGWDVFDANQLQRESKRSRIDTILPINDSFPSRKVDDSGIGLDQLYGLGPHADAGASGVGLLGNAQEKNRFSPADYRTKTLGIAQGHPDRDYVWRGVIAKGGTPVCRARCVPIGKGIQSEIPEVVNCSARTGLDLLTKHYAEAIGFDIVFFLPDSEEDFASYTEFLRYLGTRDRAGVAKFDDGTTLFLVPPSDFLTKVLNVAGPERLYGVVLKFPQYAPASTSVQPQSYQSHYADGHQGPSQSEYSGLPPEDKVLQMDYGRVSCEDSLPPPKHLAAPPTDSVAMQPTSSVNTAAVSQTGVTLTPELIATLASLLPVNTKSSGSESVQPQLGSSSMGPSTELDKRLQQQGSEQIGHPIHQVENQYNPQRQQVSHLQTHPSGLNASSSSALGMTGNSQAQDPTFHLPQQSAVSSRPSYHYEVSQNAQKYGMPQGTESVASYGSSVYQQPAKTLTLSNRVHDSDIIQRSTAMPLAAEKGNSELPGQIQQLQPGIYGASEGTSALEADKNQRYQSTLQFAANLLLQIQQQQQQQTGTQSGQGSASH